jgi:hypothetical protein
MGVCAHEVAGPAPFVRENFPGSLIFTARAEGAARSAQQTARTRKRLIPSFVSSVCPPGFRLPVVDAKISPEPRIEERAAILRALEELVARDPRPLSYRSAWREQGIRENADDGALEELS